jgi:hypothetical protein
MRSPHESFRVLRTILIRDHLEASMPGRPLRRARGNRDLYKRICRQRAARAARRNPPSRGPIDVFTFEARYLKCFHDLSRKFLPKQLARNPVAVEMFESNLRELLEDRTLIEDAQGRFTSPTKPVSEWKKHAEALGSEAAAPVRESFLGEVPDVVKTRNKYEEKKFVPLAEMTGKTGDSADPVEAGYAEDRSNYFWDYLLAASHDDRTALLLYYAIGVQEAAEDRLASSQKYDEDAARAYREEKRLELEALSHRDKMRGTKLLEALSKAEAALAEDNLSARTSEATGGYRENDIVEVFPKYTGVFKRQAERRVRASMPPELKGPADPFAPTNVPSGAWKNPSRWRRARRYR